MTTSTLTKIAPLEAALPPPPDGQPLSEAQWDTLMAFADAIIPSIALSVPELVTPASTALPLHSHQTWNALIASVPDAEKRSSEIQAVFMERASDVAPFKDMLQRALTSYVQEDAVKGMRFILSAVNTRPICYMVTGFATPFTLLSIPDRQLVLKNWSQSYLPPLRGAFKSLTLLVKNLWLRTSPTIGPALDFPPAPAHGQPEEGYDFRFEQFVAHPKPEILETDVVIVGSGCGGGVAAKKLAEAGYKVIVVEKGYHYPAKYLPMSEKNAGIHLFENAMFSVSDGGEIAIIAGSCFGGGGSVNWSASLQTQGFVRKEWAEQGLKFFESADFQHSLDSVCQQMGVSADYIDHNHANSALLEGSRRLGYKHISVPQNTKGRKHYCGYCSMGCPSCEKQGPVNYWLVHAAQAGTKFLEGFHVDEIMFETKANGLKHAQGIRGTWTSRDSSGQRAGSDTFTREVIIKAKKVIVSAGTLWTPILLLQSGLNNSNIGRNLHLHPVSTIFGVWKEPIRPWEGGILTSACSEFENLDGKGHGVKLECFSMLPSHCLGFLQWTGGADFKATALKLPYMNGFISLARDRDTGRVYPDPVSGQPRYEYAPSKFDKKHIMEGIVALAKICYVTGAEEIHVGIDGLPAFKRTAQGHSPSTSTLQSSSSSETLEIEDAGVTDPAFQSWLALVRKGGLPIPEANFASAHQMGTCRMGLSPKNSVVGQDGRVHGTENCYVADASVFPSASGVNPMITNMAISDWISQGVVKTLRREAQGKAAAVARL